MSGGQKSYELPGGVDGRGRISGRCVGHRIEIDAPPELVWDFIADFENWDQWNPLYVQTSGYAQPGGHIRFVVKLDGLKPQTGNAGVSTVRSNELLEYTMTNFGGLLKAFRFVQIEEISPTRCAVTNGEIMGGAMGGLIFRALGNKVGKRLEGMNQALRKIAELKWNGRPG